MPATDFDVERTFDDDRFVAQQLFSSDRMKVVCGYFDPGQFIPVHAPDSDVAIAIESGTGIVREGEQEHHVVPGTSSLSRQGLAVESEQTTTRDSKRSW